MGDAFGACADTMTVRPHRPNIVMKTGFLIVSALRGNTTGPDDQPSALLQLSGTELNRNSIFVSRADSRLHISVLGSEISPLDCSPGRLRRGTVAYTLPRR